MSKFISLLNDKLFTLIVSLPENSPDMAKAALEGGADVLKVHINIKHKAAGTQFGSLAKEEAKLKQILKLAKAKKVPVGIVPGSDIPATPAEMKKIIKMGFDFFDIFIDKAPSYMLKAKKIGKMVAIRPDFDLEKIMDLKNLGAQAVEAAIIPNTGYGKELMVGDLQNYISLVMSLALPVVVPTQKAVKVSEIPILWDTGVKAIMIGAIVTGTKPNSIKKAVQEFRVAIDDLG